jgi:hypothetical protein
MTRNRRFTVLAVSLALLFGGVSLASAGPASASDNGSDTKVTVGSPRGVFPRNKQNEPSVGLALDRLDRRVLVAGANEEIDNAPCHGNDCSFTPGITDNGVYFSLDGGQTWLLPTYTGWTARNGTPHVGPIGTVPWYFESGLVGDGDPATAFGPRPGPHGFSWSNGARLYYGSLASNFGTATTIRGFEAITVSRTDDVRAAARGDKNAWRRPVVVSGDQTATTFSDKDAVWADNAASSRYFGNAYACWTSFKNANSATAPAPIELSRSVDGGTTLVASCARLTCRADDGLDGNVRLHHPDGQPRGGVRLLGVRQRRHRAQQASDGPVVRRWTHLRVAAGGGRCGGGRQAGPRPRSQR